MVQSQAQSSLSNFSACPLKSRIQNRIQLACTADGTLSHTRRRTSWGRIGSINRSHRREAKPDHCGNHGVNLRSDYDVNYIIPATGLRPNPLFGDIFLEDNSR
jgi:hypothetical protein